MLFTIFLRTLPSLRMTFGCVFLTLLLYSVSVSAATTFTVTSNGDGGGVCPDAANCTLRAAIAAAMPGDTINFAVIGTIALGGAELIIDKNLTIQGPGANLLAISGENLSRVFYVDRVTASISGLTITNGNGDGADDAGSGGGIASRGPLTLTACHLTRNSAASEGGGVWLFTEGGNFNACTFSENQAPDGGGIWFGVGNSTLTLVNCTITANQATDRGAGLMVLGSCGEATLQVFNSTIANNISTGAAPTASGIFVRADSDECTGRANAILRSTIIANQSLPNIAASAGGGAVVNVVSQGFNLANDNGGGFLNQPTDILNTNPQLAPLAFYGGPTPTMALLPGSLALDKGNSFGLIFDQRGFARTFNFPAIANAADGTDIGAFELDAQSLVQVADPSVCLDPGGLVGSLVNVHNATGAPQTVNVTANLPAGLTAVPGTCQANLPGNCVIAANGGTVTWDGTVPNGQTLILSYRSRIGAGVAQGTILVINATVTIGAQQFAFPSVLIVNCPNITNTRVTDQKPGSLLVFPYYTSTIGGASDTRMTITNISNAASTTANTAYVHLFFIDGTTCAQSDLFLCLTPNASFSFKASEYDPGTTGYVLAVAVDRNGVPIQNNVLIGNAFVNTPQFLDNYGAESFWANSTAVAAVNGNTATLFFDQLGYDAVPKQFVAEIQSPMDAVGQQVITASLSGDLTTGQLTGAAQVGTAQAFNEKEVFASFNGWLTGTCQARATISTASPRVPNTLGNLIKTGQAGSLKFNVGGAVGLLLTPRTATWKGIRTLHKTLTTTTSLTIPIFVPVC